MKDAAKLRTALAHYTGTVHYYRHPFSRCTYTDGVKFFAQNAGGGAYWLLDILLTQPEVLQAQREHGMVFCWLTVTPDRKAVLHVERDGGEPELYRRAIDWTDCPEGKWLFYFVDDILLIPSEY